MANNQQNQGQQNQNQQNQRGAQAQNNPGNFKNDPARAAEAGRKGGEAQSGSRSEASSREE